MTPTMAFAEETRSLVLRRPQGDPIRFSDNMKGVAFTLERRTDEELEEDGLHHADPVLREHALYHLITRKGSQALRVAEAAVFGDTDPLVRINVLWLLQETVAEQAARFAKALTTDTDARVREWARVLSWECGGADFRTATEASYIPGRTFDETLFLHIQCHLYVRLKPGNDLWGHIILSPQMLARIYGQALACPVMETREHELVIAKTLSGLHEDGSDHYESFLFRGFTDRTAADTGRFYFEAFTPRPFYKSGRADDASEGVVEDVMVPFAREGEWYLNTKLKIKDQHPIEFVRGRFQGWAFVNVDRMMKSDGDLLSPGNSVLGTLHHPEVGPMTNAFLSGTFKGKILDWNHDGILDFNAVPAHATRAGEVDSDLDGVPDVPGRTVCARPLGR